MLSLSHALIKPYALILWDFKNLHGHSVFTSGKKCFVEDIYSYMHMFWILALLETVADQHLYCLATIDKSSHAINFLSPFILWPGVWCITKVSPQETEVSTLSTKVQDLGAPVRQLWWMQSTCLTAGRYVRRPHIIGQLGTDMKISCPSIGY